MFRTIVCRLLLLLPSCVVSFSCLASAVDIYSGSGFGLLPALWCAPLTHLVNPLSSKVRWLWSYCPPHY